MPHRNHLLRDFNRLARRMRINYLMRNKPSKKMPFKLPSTWNPMSSYNTSLEDYLAETKLQLSKIKRHNVKSNITKAEKIALKNLENNKDIVVKPLDKGRGCAIVSHQQYTQEGERQLSGFQYQRIDNDITNETATLVKNAVTDLFENNHISKETFQYLLPDNHEVETPSLYFLVKAHKPKPDDSAFAGRPIVSGCNSPTKYISEFIDYFLLPIVQRQPTYLKDSSHLIRILDDLHLDPDVKLVTCDVTSLYTNIPQDECIDLVCQCLENTKLKYDIAKPPTFKMRILLELILKRNCFEFNGNFYKQTTGVSMGNNASPELSDIALHALEKRFLEFDANILFYYRYRDDIFMGYRSSDENLETLIRFMNNAHQTLKFTFEVSNHQVTFLDLEIYKGARFLESGVLDHRVHTKATDTFQYLSYDSAHPRSVFRGLIKGETIRYARCSTNQQEFLDKVSFFSSKLENRGYNKHSIKKITNGVNHDLRYRYLYSSKPPTKNIPLVFVTHYAPQIHTTDLKSAFQKHWHFIEDQPTLVKLFPEPPILAFKRAKNIRDMIVKSKLPVSVDDSHTTVNKRSKKSSEVSSEDQIPMDANDIELIEILASLMNG